MKRRAVGAVALLCCLGVSHGLDLDSVCLVDDLPTLIEQGMLFDTSGVLGSIDSVNVVGGTCDSAYLMVTTSLLPIPIPIPVTIEKLNSCSAHVTVEGYSDTVVNVCDMAPVSPPAVSAGRGGGRGTGTLLTRSVAGGVLFVYRGGRAAHATVTVDIHACDGRLIRRLRMAADGERAVSSWDGRGRDGRVAVAGRYLCRARADGRTVAMAWATP